MASGGWKLAYKLPQWLANSEKLAWFALKLSGYCQVSFRWTTIVFFVFVFAKYFLGNPLGKF